MKEPPAEEIADLQAFNQYVLDNLVSGLATASADNHPYVRSLGADQVIDYTTDGTTYQSFAPVPTVTTADAVPVIVDLDFSAIAAADNNPLFGIRLTFLQGDGGTAGNNRFDNITVRGPAVPPEPDNVAPVVPVTSFFEPTR